MDEDVAARQVVGQRFPARFGGRGERVDHAGDRIGGDRRRLVEAQASVRFGDHKIGEGSAGIDGETKPAPTQMLSPDRRSLPACLAMVYAVSRGTTIDR